ncbi:integrase, catalytic region, zinc finger, CCHC-type containing protein [Tanacetum coccineum]
MKRVNIFIPMETKDRGRASELAAGSSQATITDSAEVRSSKRPAKAELDYEGSKKQKTDEVSGSFQEQQDEEEKELTQEDLQQMMMVVLVEEVYVEALQSLVKERFNSTEPTDDKERILWVELKRLFEPNTDDTLWKLYRYMHDPLKWRIYDTCGVHHVSTERGIDIFMLVEKDYPLSNGVLMLTLVNKLLVEHHLEMIDSSLAVHVFKQKDDLIDAINNKMSFLSTVFLSRFPTTNNQLRNSSNPRQQATILDGRVTVQPVQRRQSSFTAGSGKVLNEEELEFLADPRVAEGPVTPMVITHNATYQADDLDAYDSDCVDFSTAKEVVMSNLSSYRSDVLSEFLGTVKFGNDQIAKIIRYGDYQIGNITISRVYYVEGLGHNLFSVGQFCDSDLEVAFRKHTCFVRNLKGDDLLSGYQETNLYTLSMGDMMTSFLICLLSKASKTKSWLWHGRLSHLNFGVINHLAKNGLVQDDYSRFTWVKFLALKDEAPDFIIKFLKMIQVRLNTPVRNIRTYNGTEFVNQTLRSYYESVGISHETSVALSPQENCVVERRNSDLSYLHVFGALCYPNNNSKDLGKLQAKADKGIFIGYAPKKNAYRIYNRRTRKIIETIYVDFEELMAMASEQLSLGPGLQCMTPATSCSGLVTNTIPQQPCIPPPRDDWDRLFQPMFDQYFNPPTIAVSPVPVADAPRTIDLADSLVSTSIDQDAPSTKSPKTPHFHDDPLHKSLHEDSTSQKSSSNVRPIHTPFESLGRWTKDHPIVNVIEPKNFKQAMIEPSWIDAMQEEIHEFE